MELGERLRARRERLSLTQEWVAEALEIPRELLSYWETGARQPNATHLRNLARIYRTSSAELSDPAFDAGSIPVADVLPDADLPPATRAALKDWASSLDRWARFLVDDLGRTPAGPDRPPGNLGETGTVTDRRRASALADRARDHWSLGQFALPDLYALLDQKGILVQRLPLGELGRAAGISGAFYNHGEIGYCVVVNVQATPARQAFTLAHGVAHALFHHAEVGVLCRILADDRLEKFADAFGEQFLVPGKVLRYCVEELLRAAGRDDLQPVDALRLGNLFRVSYPTIVMRLASERILPDETAARWREIDGPELAQRLGIQPPAFALSAGATGPLNRYPVSVLATSKHAVQRGRASAERVAEVLAVDPSALRDHLLAAPPEPASSQAKEHAEFETILAERSRARMA